LMNRFRSIDFHYAVGCKMSLCCTWRQTHDKKRFKREPQHFTDKL
jgi:hypothetical protein